MPCGGYCHASLGQSMHITRHWAVAFTPVHRTQRNHLARKVSRGQSCSRQHDFVRLCVRVRSRQEQRHVQVEKSELAHTEIIYFMYQMSLDMQLQRALNMDDFERAQEIRTKREQIDEVVAQHLAAKGPGCGTSSANQTAVADLASEGLRLRSELQRAIDEERYSDAASIRDKLKVIQEDSAEAASQASGTQAVERRYQLGQRVKHAELGYDGVICGSLWKLSCEVIKKQRWDNSCCEAEKWHKASSAAELQHGQQQPFYQVLVDAKDWDTSWASPAVAYVAQELLNAPEPPATWPEVYGYDSFDHAYLYNLFLGQDAQGNMLPVRQLRDRYSQQRKDVHPKSESNEDSDGTSAPD